MGPSHLEHCQTTSLSASELTSFPLPDLVVGTVHIWRVDLDEFTGRSRRVFQHLSTEERARATRSRGGITGSRFAQGRGHLREILGAYCGVAPARVEIGTGPHGKPCLIGACGPHHLSFNMSYAGRIAAIAVTNGAEIGIDVEPASRYRLLDQMAVSVFNPAELQLLAVMPPWKRMMALVRGWTRKEAVLKAVGCGLVEDLTRIQVLGSTDEPFSAVSFQGDWHVVDVPLTGFDCIASLAVPAGTAAIHVAA
jgi:4'-phosphopantetheinyl transferase